MLAKARLRNRLGEERLVEINCCAYVESLNVEEESAIVEIKIYSHKFKNIWKK